MENVAVVRPVGVGQANDPTIVEQAAGLLQGLVRSGAALGWVDPPSLGEVSSLLRDLATESEQADACLLAAWIGSDLAGIGYWKRYSRPTHRVHADIQKLAVDPMYQGHGLGHKLMVELIATAGKAGIEVLTLDFRGDNERAARLYRSFGFTEYGRLHRFVAVGSARYDKVCYAYDLRNDRPQ